MSGKKYLPSANEFTPRQINLQYCLEKIKSSSSRKDFLEILVKQYFYDKAKARRDPDERHQQQLKLAGNVLIGLRNYKLVNDEDLSLSKIGASILSKPSAEKRILIRHFFETLCGYEIVEAINSLKAKGIAPRNKKFLAQELTLLGLKTKQGKTISENTTDHTKFITWLDYCGVLNSEFEIDENVFTKAVGRQSGLVSELWGLTDQQQLFLKHLWEVMQEVGDEFRVKDLKSGAEKKFGKFIQRPDQIAHDILYPLEEMGFFSIIRKSKGRGGDSGSIQCQRKLSHLVPSDFVKGGIQKSPVQITKPIDQIFRDLDSSNISVKGVALEHLAISIGQGLGLRFLEFRAQSADTGGAEVDVIFEQIGLTYSKWLFQCKNTPKNKVHVSAVAKEVGNAIIHHANVIVMITTGGFTSAAREYAKKTIAKSNLQVVLVDGKEIEKFKKNGVSSLSKFLETQSEKVAAERAATQH